MPGWQRCPRPIRGPGPSWTPGRHPSLRQHPQPGLDATGAPRQHAGSVHPKGSVPMQALERGAVGSGSTHCPACAATSPFLLLGDSWAGWGALGALNEIMSD